MQNERSPEFIGLWGLVTSLARRTPFCSQWRPLGIPNIPNLRSDYCPGSANEVNASCSPIFPLLTFVNRSAVHVTSLSLGNCWKVYFLLETWECHGCFYIRDTLYRRFIGGELGQIKLEGKCVVMHLTARQY